LTAGSKALVLWFPSERIPLLNGLMIMLGALGALTATLPAEFLLVSVGWRALFKLLTIASAGCALVVYLVVPRMPAAISVVERSTISLRTVFAHPRFWRLAPLSATCIGTAWALQGLWAAAWLSDVEGLDRPELLWHRLLMAIGLSLGALLWGIAVDRLRRRGVGPRALLGLVAAISSPLSWH
jgi:sugar phosphate permease